MATTQYFSRAMTRKAILFVVLLSLGGFIFILKSPAPGQNSPYLHPALLWTRSEAIPVIVTADDSSAAVRAVEAVGGVVTSDLWLIDAVAATLSTNQIEALISSAEIVSIVPDAQVRTAIAPRDGYMSERRHNKGMLQLNDEQMIPAVPLPDGGAVSVAKAGIVLFLNSDGSERARSQLSGGNYKTSPVVSADGTIFLAKEEKVIYALNPDGSIRWRFTNVVEKLEGGLALAADETLYAADVKRWLYALDPGSGQLLWRTRIGTNSADIVTHAPVMGPDGTIYMVTAKGFLFAVDPAGTLRWTFQTAQGKALYPPLVQDNGTVYVADHEKNVYGVNSSNGSQQFAFQTHDKIMAPPVLAPDGSLFVTDEKLRLYALNPNGSQRFLFAPQQGAKFLTSPVISPDASTVFVASEGRWIFAVDAVSGVERWRYQMRDLIKAQPVIDRWGNLVAGSEGQDLVFLTPAGEIVYTLSLPGKLQQEPGHNGRGDLVVRVNTKSVATVGRLPDEWNGEPDVQATANPMVWKLLAPVAIDIGADILHEDLLRNGYSLSGQGSAIAVVDSGVYFDEHVKAVLGNSVAQLFLGQADYVGAGTCEASGPGYQQYAGYCWTDHQTSKDRFGHGSHVAGIIWNQYVDQATGIKLGVAPGAKILSVRVLGDDGIGTYTDTIEGIQFVIETKDTFGIRVLNLSLSGYASTPYFADPLNRAAEAAWASGLVVVVAAGNSGPYAESVTVPGSDPYVITVGAINSRRTAGYWADDEIPSWSASGPTLDGFVKPDVLAPGANVVSFMYNHPTDPSQSAYLVRQHPDYSETQSLFRMNGTSMSAAVVSGVVALMLERNPDLTPDQVKYRLMYSAMFAVTPDDEPLYSPLQQGSGRVWAPNAAVSMAIPPGQANDGMDILADLAHPWHDGDSLDPEVNPDLYYHYLGPVQRLVSDDGQAYLYFVAVPDDENPDSWIIDPLGVVLVNDMKWLDSETLAGLALTFDDGEIWWNDDYLWSAGRYNWSGGRYNWSGGRYNWSGGRYNWSGGRYNWSGGRYNWSGGRYNWSGGRYNWSGGRYNWSGGRYNWSGGRYNWSGQLVDPTTINVSATRWIESDEEN
jgi:outer membrane protein assembly factor BamB